MKETHFPTLYAALVSENLLDSWKLEYAPIQYNETRRYTWDDGSKHGRQISIYRASNGRYERPVHYQR